MAFRDNPRSVDSLCRGLRIRRSVLLLCWSLFLGSLFLGSTPCLAADYREAEQLFFHGRYEACERMARAEVDRGVWNEKWPMLLLRCQLTTGQYEAAVETYEQAAARFRHSIALRMIGHDVFNFANRPEDAVQQYTDIVQLVRRSAWRYSSSTDRLVLGRFLLKQGEDAREILELSFDRARRSNPKLADVYIATAELALEKHDYQEAAKTLDEAVRLQPDNPYIHYLLGRAWQPSDGEKAAAAIQKALELNPRHIDSLLFQVDHLIDAESYDEAETILTQVLTVNHRDPEAWAYHAVLAHLAGHGEGEQALRAAALSSWETNPQVDHLIGKKLSRKYRFAEGAAYQRRALERDPNLLAAKFHLSQDLLRLGDEEEGWRLADEVHEQDGYNVVAYNVVTLRDAMAKFTTLESERFQLRMATREAEIYGEQALDWLEQAHAYFCEKYDVTMDGPVTVEIFPQQKDFAIRTFGLPGGAGYLGVCFGRVITANSPSSQGERPANWRSVLWHEFCHVVTLEKTRNKMPRWLSEGISTYEEQEKNESWGERLTPHYRRMIAGEDLTPVSQLSSAFLRPKSPVHLQFAYFESSLVVRYLIEQYGLDTLKRILDDLAVGMPINDALTRYVGSLAALDQEFADYARELVAKSAPEIDWESHEELAQLTVAGAAKWLKDHPRNYFAMMRYATLAIEAKDYETAERVLLEAQSLHPDDAEPDGTLALLGQLYRRTGKPDKEVEVLTRFAQLNDRALEVYARLGDALTEAENWEGVRENAKRYLAVQPLQPRGYELLASAAEPLRRYDELAVALKAMLSLDPIDPAGLHYRIATAYERDRNPTQAKRHVLMALEHAPRYRDAQRLLLKLVKEDGRPAGGPVSGEGT